MTLKSITLCAILGSTFAAVGCDEQPATPTPTPTAAETATPAEGGVTIPPTLRNAQDQAQATADAAQAKMAEAGNAAAAKAEAAGEKAEQAADTLVAQATKLYEEAKAAINKADFAGAQKYVDQLSALKDKLPPEWQTKVEEVSKLLAEGKNKLGSMNLPGLPK